MDMTKAELDFFTNVPRLLVEGVSELKKLNKNISDAKASVPSVLNELQPKFLVVANTYGGGYGCEVTCFGVFNSEEEALKFVFDHPVCKVKSAYSDDEVLFDFFYYWDSGATAYKDKMEYAKSFIRKIDGSPVPLGGYEE